MNDMQEKILALLNKLKRLEYTKKAMDVVAWIEKNRDASYRSFTYKLEQLEKVDWWTMFWMLLFSIFSNINILIYLIVAFLLWCNFEMTYPAEMRLVGWPP